MMMFGFIEFLIVPLLLMLQGSGDPLDHLDSALFWQERGVKMEAGTLVQLAKPPATADAKTLEALAARLGAPGFRERRDAERQLLAAGPDALPFLAPLEKNEDPEVAERAAAIVASLEKQGQGGWLTRLMAIRALGELKAESALPILLELEKSPDQAVREYAARAVAAVRGNPEPRHVRAPGMAAAMLRAFPAAEVTASISPIGDSVMTVPALLAKLPDGIPGVDPAQVQKEMVKVIETIGPFRLDQVIVRARLPNDEQGFGIGILLQGRFDHPHITKALQSFEDGPRVTETLHGEGVTFHLLKHMGVVALIPPDRILFQTDEAMMAGNASLDAARLQQVIRALQPGQVPPPGNPDPMLETLVKNHGVLLADLTTCPEISRELEGVNRVKVLLSKHEGKVGLDSDLVFGDEQTAARIVQMVQGGLAMALPQLKTVDEDLHKSLITWLKADGFKAAGKAMEIRLNGIPPDDILRMFFAAFAGFHKMEAQVVDMHMANEADPAEVAPPAAVAPAVPEPVPPGNASEPAVPPPSGRVDPKPIELKK